MPSFTDILPHKTPAEASDVQQLIDALSARRNTPLAVTINDPLAYTITLKNTDPAGRACVVYAPDGVTVLFAIDATGAKVSRAGGAAQAPITDLGSGAGAAAEGNHVHGVGGYAGTGTVSLETLYAGTWVTTAVNYVVAAAVLVVFCSSGVQVTLPAAASTNRPITIKSLIGTSTVTAVGGTIEGGSVNTTTGLVMDGTVSPLDAITYKSDGTNWHAV